MNAQAQPQQSKHLVPGSTEEFSFVGLLDFLPEIHRVTKGDLAVTIAVLDGKPDLRHPCLEPHPQLELFPSPSVNPSGHGTHVTGVIFGQSHCGVEGIAPACRGVLIPIFHENEKGYLKASSQSELAEAIHQALDAGADIINISGGELTQPAAAVPGLKEAIQRCAEEQKLIVAAAGNDACACVHVPAAMPHVLAVGAIDPSGTPRSYSNWGRDYRYQGILAPGTNIPGPVPGGEFMERSGTSFAAPIVAGIAGLLMSAARKMEIELSPQEARRILIASASPCPNPHSQECDRYLAGVLNIRQAWNQLLERAPDRLSSSLKSISKYSNNTVMNSNEPLNEEQVAHPLAPSEEADTTALAAAPAAGLAPSEVEPAECSCKSSKQAEQVKDSDDQPAAEEKTAFQGPRIAYPIGQFGLAYLNETQFLLTQELANQDPDQTKGFEAKVLYGLKQYPEEVLNLVLVLHVNSTPIFALAPQGTFSAEAYAKIVDLYTRQLSVDPSDRVIRAAVPGYIRGEVQLISGQKLPVLNPSLQGMKGWTYEDLVSTGNNGKGNKGGDNADHESLVKNFIARISYEFRNRGIQPKDRALNFGATHLAESHVFADYLERGYAWKDIEVKPSILSRPGQNLWDVVVVFFNPKEAAHAKQNFTISVDVSYVEPVTYGEASEFYSY